MLHMVTLAYSNVGSDKQAREDRGRTSTLAQPAASVLTRTIASRGRIQSSRLIARAGGLVWSAGLQLPRLDADGLLDRAGQHVLRQVAVAGC